MPWNTIWNMLALFYFLYIKTYQWWALIIGMFSCKENKLLSFRPISRRAHITILPSRPRINGRNCFLSYSCFLQWLYYVICSFLGVNSTFVPLARNFTWSARHQVNNLPRWQPVISVGYTENTVIQVILVILMYLCLWIENVKTMHMEKESTLVLDKNKSLFETWK